MSKPPPPWSGRPIDDRMDEALVRLAGHWTGKRRPKAFYLGPADWEDFEAMAREKVTVPWGNNPPVMREEPAFNGVPVRPSQNVPPHQSRLYDHTGTAHPLPR